MATYTELRAESDSLTSQIKEINSRIATASDAEKAQLIAERSQLASRQASVTSALLETPGPVANQQYVGKDPQTGLNRYYDPVTGRSTIVPDEPTANQQSTYNANNPPQEPVKTDTASDTTASNAAPASDTITGNIEASANAAISTDNTTTSSGSKTEVNPAPNTKETSTQPPPEDYKKADNTTTTTEGSTAAAQIPSNVLHGYTNYTYLITLHLLTKENYHSLVLNDTKKFESTNVLISSAGRFNDQRRNKLWKEDFFIEDLDIDTVIGLNSGHRGTNAILIEFKIVEPNGFTFLERLIRTSEEIGHMNYLELIYGLEIEFVGYDDEGVAVKIPDTRKYIPIKFATVSMEVSPQGAEYRVTALPYNHQAFSVMRVSTPINIAVTAATVADYFTTSRDAEDAEDARGATVPEENRGAIDRQLARLPPPKYQDTKSFVTAINRYERRKVKEGTQDYADEFYVVFDSEIGEASLAFDDKKTQVTNTPIKTGDRIQTPNGTASTPDINARVLREFEKLKAGNASLDNLFTFTNFSGSKYNFTQLTSDLQERMVAMATEYRERFGQKIRIESAFRTREDQERIRNNPALYGANYTIGRDSVHFRGAAVDISKVQADQAESSGLLAKYGLRRPDPKGDPVHIVVGPRTPAYAGSSTPPSIEQQVNDAPRREINYKVVRHEINAGTNIIDEINRVVRNSSFLLSQLVDPASLDNKTAEEIAAETELLLNTELKWWRIIPRVELLEYDKKRRTYAKRVTYFVKPYIVNSSMVPLTPSAPPTSYVRDYNYMFTGQNVDVEDFKIDLNALYFIALTANAYKLNSTSRSPDTKSSTSQNVPATVYADSIANPTVHMGSGTEYSLANEGSERTGRVSIAADLQEFLLNIRGGHMLVLELTILGDPALIKQDDIFSGENVDSSNLNGSIVMDAREVYVRVTFRTPVDYGDDTGLADKMEQSIFSGMYKIIQVRNTFNAGQFKQKLMMVRVSTALLDGNEPASDSDITVK